MDTHWKVAYKIFQDNKLTGIGLKNFRVLSCNDDNYKFAIYFTIAHVLLIHIILIWNFV